MTFYKRERPVLADFIVDNASGKELTRFYGKKYLPKVLVLEEI